MSSVYLMFDIFGGATFVCRSCVKVEFLNRVSRNNFSSFARRDWILTFARNIKAAPRPVLAAKVYR